MAKDSTFSLNDYKQFTGKIKTSRATYGVDPLNWGEEKAIRNYTIDDVQKIIDSSGITSKRQLSRNFFNSGGIYQRIIMHYSTLLYYYGLLVPSYNPSISLSKKKQKSTYTNALHFIDKSQLPLVLTEKSIKILTEGEYYGLVMVDKKQGLSILDLPIQYCRTRFKDLQGRDIIEFNLEYFDQYNDEIYLEAISKAFPKEMIEAYDLYRKGRRLKWYLFPVGQAVYFSFLDDYGAPPFVSIIPAIMQYKDSVSNELSRQLEEIRKILVQKVPHLSDGTLLFEPVEAEEMHFGAVDMVKDNEYLSVLTTYNDVSSIISKTSNDSSSDIMNNMAQNIYNAAGVSGQLFTSNGSTTLEYSINNDISLITPLINKYSAFITQVINDTFGNGSIVFNYQILPVGEYNHSDYVDLTLKMANSGYSFLMPAAAMGISPNELVNLKDMENDILDLSEKLIPLATSYTQSGQEGAGAPTKDETEKSEKTIENEKSLDNTGGGSK